jgi:hypothetical protein
MEVIAVSMRKLVDQERSFQIRRGRTDQTRQLLQQGQGLELQRVKVQRVLSGRHRRFLK